MRHHIVTSSTKVYIRHRENYPETIMMASAYEGFSKLGAEIIPYYWIDDIDNIDDLGPETMIVGYINDVLRGLHKLGKPIPDTIDYPASLDKYMSRNISEHTLKEVRESDDTMFIKPVEHKLFTGFVWKGRKDQASRRRIVQHHDDTKVWSCSTLNMVSEYRAMILHGEILDVRRYKGDWSLAPNKFTVNQAVKDYESSGKAPASYTLDFAVTDLEEDVDLGPDDFGNKIIEQRPKTVLVEANDGFAFGNYGLLPEAYASCLAARWKELTS